ncbi:MAG TPA: methyltransferase domain-containing protein [Rhizomicrobium sp.]
MSLEEDPVVAGEVLIAQGHADEAVRLLRGRLESGRGGLLLKLTLQRALLAADDAPGALAIARETALTNPGIAVAAVGLGEALLACGHLPAAIGEFQRALRLDAGLDDARAKLGSAWLQAGEAEKALDAWQTIAATDHSPAVRTGIAEAEAMRQAPRSDARYVRHLFDQFSADYDSRMIDQLHYGAPGILRELAGLLGLGARAPLTILDLGCGTGLMGAALRDWAGTLVGVDLSPLMIEKARARNIYNALHVGDIDAWLAADTTVHDLVVAADTLVYLGDLSSVFAHVAARLSPCAGFLFTVEKKEGDGFELGPKRRWRHSERYLRVEASRAGYEIAGLMACHPRTEAGIPVEGLAVALLRPRV